MYIITKHIHSVSFRHHLAQFFQGGQLAPGLGLFLTESPPRISSTCSLCCSSMRAMKSSKLFWDAMLAVVELSRSICFFWSPPSVRRWLWGSWDFHGFLWGNWLFYQTKGKGLLTRVWEIGWDWTTNTAWCFNESSMGAKPPTAGINAGHPKVSLSPIGRYLLFLALCIWHTPATSTSSTHWISSRKDTGTIINPALEVGFYCKPHEL